MAALEAAEDGPALEPGNERPDWASSPFLLIRESEQLFFEKYN
jgi:hypothetical protein